MQVTWLKPAVPVGKTAVIYMNAAAVMPQIFVYSNSSVPAVE